MSQHLPDSLQTTYLPLLPRLDVNISLGFKVIAVLTRYPQIVEVDVCTLVEELAADREACTSNEDCTSCVSTSLISDPTLTCRWFPDLNLCEESCKMFGCGETTCQDDDKPPPPPPCETFESCGTCINDYCSWAVGVGCLESCDMIADVICYGPEDTPPPGSVDVCSAV